MPTTAVRAIAILTITAVVVFIAALSPLASRALA